ncbi:Uncharacterised protein [Pragia fontium]|nr:Uncharacterised protein [Pragia fontium]VEJ56955.1 Uncharacterised protein [Pragia fontium]
MNDKLVFMTIGVALLMFFWLICEFEGSLIGLTH